MELQCYFIQPTSERDDWVGVLCDEDASLGQLSCMQIDTGCEPWRVDAIFCSATPSTCAICSSVSERVRRPQAGTAPGRPLTRRGSRWYDLLVQTVEEHGRGLGSGSRPTVLPQTPNSADATTSTRGSTSTRVPELRWRSSRRPARCAGGTTPSCTRCGCICHEPMWGGHGAGDIPTELGAAHLRLPADWGPVACLGSQAPPSK